jgi:cellulose synthase/poly-beta-1,6-N-acetylglucosamine synthase-like glycosyltransferase
MARRDSRIKLLARPRGGQTATQHALFEAATGDIVVLTDAETRFAAQCLSRLVAPFADRRVGCTTGKLEWRDVEATATASNEGLYWRYERSVRDVESHAGLLTAVTGALLAVRRSAYRPVPATASMDHLLPLYVRERGGLVLYVADAVATDRPISGLREQFRNRSRTATRGIAANLSMATRLTPWRHPAAAVAIWSHKLLRWATPWLIVAAVASAAVLALTTGDAGYGFVVVVVAAAGAGAATAHVLSRAGLKPPALLAFLRAFAVVNLAFVVAWLNVLRGRRIEAWHRADWRATS